MRLRLDYSAFVVLLLITEQITAKIFVNVINNGLNSSLDTYWCYEDMLSNFSMQLNDLKLTNQRLNEELADQKQTLVHIKSLLEKGQEYYALPGNCAEAVRASEKSGIYKIYLRTLNVEPFNVYCLIDPNDERPWTVIQRRLDGSMNFYRGWHDYKNGFGRLEHEFFIGLDKLHALTNARRHELWIKLEDFEGEIRHAKYEAFAIGNENSQYVLNVLGDYHGDAGDALFEHQGKKFSTKDSDNDANPDGRCAVAFTGAWWYGNCHTSNLNGKYLKGSNTKGNEAQGIQWMTWHNNYSLKSVHMAIRLAI